MLGWLVAGLVAGVAVAAVISVFWDDIANWLNNTAADAVERALGYNAKKNMQRAVVIVDRIVNMVRNTGTIYTKEHVTDGYFTKVTYEAEAPAYQIEEDVLKEIKDKGQLVNQFEYHSS